MFRHANLVVTAWDGALLVGVSRTLTDFAYTGYLADLAVRMSHQRRGIGVELVAKTRERMGPRASLVLLAAPRAVDYYPRIGFTRHDSAWVLRGESRCTAAAGPEPDVALRIVRLGSERPPGEGLRIGTVRRPPRGVPKAEIAARYYDLWLPELAPSEGLVRVALDARDERAWRSFARRYRAEMKRPGARRLLALLAALSRVTELSVGCYCADETAATARSCGGCWPERGAEIV